MSLLQKWYRNKWISVWRKIKFNPYFALYIKHYYKLEDGLKCKNTI